MVRDVSRLYPGLEWALSGEEGPGSCHRPTPTPVLRAGPSNLRPCCLNGHPPLKTGMMS